MSALRIAGALVAAAMLVPTAATAGSISEKDVTSGKVRIDPSIGYIMISGAERQMGMFIRVPDADTWREWEADRLKAFTKAQRKYPSKLASWESQAAVARQSGAAVPAKPDEPKLERFMIDPIELRDIEAYGPMYAYSKDSVVTYVSSVKPGTWIWYGPIMMAPNGTSVGSCNCMGTVKFEVKPGVLTDLGNSLALLPQWDSEKDVGRLLLDEMNAKRAANGKAPLKTLNTGQLRYGAPASLAAWPVAKAELQASGKLNNFYGLTISRVAPIPGVLAYKRDTIIDVRTGKEIESPTIVSRAKIKK